MRFIFIIFFPFLHPFRRHHHLLLLFLQSLFVSSILVCSLYLHTMFCFASLHLNRLSWYECVMRWYVFLFGFSARILCVFLFFFYFCFCVCVQHSHILTWSSFLCVRQPKPLQIGSFSYSISLYFSLSFSFSRCRSVCMLGFVLLFWFLFVFFFLFFLAFYFCFLGVTMRIFAYANEKLCVFRVSSSNWYSYEL